MALQRVDDRASHEMRWKCSKIKKFHCVMSVKVKNCVGLS